MKLNSKYIIRKFILIGVAASSSFAAASNHDSLEPRGGSWNFDTCRGTSPGTCTVYVATSDEDVVDYRTFTLFDYKCKILNSVRTENIEERMDLRGLPKPVTITLDQGRRPWGHIAYTGIPTVFDQSAACFKPQGSDGTGCRKAFPCPAE